MAGSRPLHCCAVVLVVLGSALLVPLASAATDRPEQINVAYFQQWPAPLQFAQASQTFDRVLGLKLNWLPYRSGQLEKSLDSYDRFITTQFLP